MQEPLRKNYEKLGRDPREMKSLVEKNKKKDFLKLEFSAIKMEYL